MPDTDTLAIAAHLHVLLRRKTGRVTDTEWMAVNADYAREIVRFARQHAVEDNLPELAEWADRLDMCCTRRHHRPCAARCWTWLRRRCASGSPHRHRRSCRGTWGASAEGVASSAAGSVAARTLRKQARRGQQPLELVIAVGAQHL